MQNELTTQQYFEKADDLSNQLMVKLNSALAGNALKEEEKAEEEDLNWDDQLAKERDPDYKGKSKRRNTI